MFAARSLGLLVLAFALPLSVVGCATETDDDDDPVGYEEDVETGEDALSGSAAAGARFATTARLNFRERPSTSATIKRVLARGAIVTIVRSTPQNGFYQVSSGGEQGWVFGRYLTAPGAASRDDDAPSGTATGQVETCRASFYASGQRTANGERFDPNAMTAAHKTLPFNTRVRVTNTANGRSVTVRINDRGPFIAGRCIDLSRASFAAIAPTSQGVASVRVEVLR